MNNQIRSACQFDEGICRFDEGIYFGHDEDHTNQSLTTQTTVPQPVTINGDTHIYQDIGKNTVPCVITEGPDLYVQINNTTVFPKDSTAVECLVQCKVATNFEIESELSKFKELVVRESMTLIKMVPYRKRCVIVSAIQNLVNCLEFVQNEQNDYYHSLAKEPVDLSKQPSEDYGQSPYVPLPELVLG